MEQIFILHKQEEKGDEADLEKIFLSSFNQEETTKNRFTSTRQRI